jgi:hypothetical protein
MQEKFNITNKKLVIFFGILTIPNLFNNLNLIDNHQIFSNLILYKNYTEYFFNHPEIIIKFDHSTYRPLFYIFKGVEFFLFKDNSFYYFLLRSIIFVVSSIFFYKTADLFINNIFLKLTLSILPTLNPYSVDFFYRAGPQESFIIIFLSIIIYSIFLDLKKKILLNKYLIITSIISISLIKESFAVMGIFFTFYFYLFSNKLKREKILIITFLIQVIILIVIISNYIKLGHTYGVENNYQLLKILNLMITFPTNIKINTLFILLQIILFLIAFKKDFKEILILLFFLNIFYFLNYFIYQGWSIKRYQIVYVICIYILFLYIFSLCNKYKKNYEKIIKYFFYIILFFCILFHYINVYKTISFNHNFKKQLVKIVNNQKSIIISDKIEKIDLEKFTSLVIFIKYFDNNKQIYTFNKNNISKINVEKKNNKILIKKEILNFYQNKSIFNNSSCLIFIKKKGDIYCPIKNNEIKIF